jgi:hypothetical protein
VHENKDSNLQISQEAISHLSQNSTTFLADQKPVEATIRSHEEARSIPSSEVIISNVSIEASPLKRRGITVKRIS